MAEPANPVTSLIGSSRGATTVTRWSSCSPPARARAAAAACIEVALPSVAIRIRIDDPLRRAAEPNALHA
jgi:hypothetical protein